MLRFQLHSSISHSVCFSSTTQMNSPQIILNVLNIAPHSFSVIDQIEGENVMNHFSSNTSWTDTSFKKVDVFKNPVVREPLFYEFLKQLIDCNNYDKALEYYQSLEEKLLHQDPPIQEDCITFYVNDTIRFKIFSCFFQNLKTETLRENYNVNMSVDFIKHPLVDYLFSKKWWCSVFTFHFAISVLNINVVDPNSAESEKQNSEDFISYLYDHIISPRQTQVFKYTYRDTLCIRQVYKKMPMINAYPHESLSGYFEQIASDVIRYCFADHAIAERRLRLLFSKDPQLMTDIVVDHMLYSGIRYCCEWMLYFVLDECKLVLSQGKVYHILSALIDIREAPYKTDYTIAQFSEKWYYEITSRHPVNLHQNLAINLNIVLTALHRCRYDMLVLLLRDGCHIPEKFSTKVFDWMKKDRANLSRGFAERAKLDDPVWMNLFDKQYNKYMKTLKSA